MAQTEEKKKIFKKRRKKPCIFCTKKAAADYKNIDFMRRFITDRGKIAPKRMTGCCAKHQREIAMAVKRARVVGLLPYVID